MFVDAFEFLINQTHEHFSRTVCGKFYLNFLQQSTQPAWIDARRERTCSNSIKNTPHFRWWWWWCWGSDMNENSSNEISFWRRKNCKFSHWSEIRVAQRRETINIFLFGLLFPLFSSPIHSINTITCTHAEADEFHLLLLMLSHLHLYTEAAASRWWCEVCYLIFWHMMRADVQRKAQRQQQQQQPSEMMLTFIE